MDHRVRPRLTSWVLLVAVVLLLPDLTNAQDLFVSRLAAFPFLGGAPAERFGGEPGTTISAPLTFYAGWGADSKATTLSFNLRHPSSGPFADDLLSIKNSYPVRGLWLGHAAQMNLWGGIGLFGDYWVLVPTNKPADETFSFTDAPSGGKTWGTDTAWWFTDAALTCQTCGLGELLAGFRYDRFETSFKDPGNFFGPIGSSSNTGDVTINCYIPFVGVQTDQGTPGGSRLMFRVIGFPWLGGDVIYHDSIGNFTVLTQDRIELEKGVGKGYFLEAFAEYGQAVFSGATVSVFGRWNLLHGSANRIDITDVFGGTPLTGEYQFAFDRQSWTLGGSFSLDFTIPWIGAWL